VCLIAKAASQYHAGPPAGQIFRKAMRQEGLEPAGPDSVVEEMTRRGVVGSVSFQYSSKLLQSSRFL